jgi:ribonuclease HI
VGGSPVLSGKSVQQRADILQGTIPAGGKSDVRQNTVLASELARAFALTLPGSSGVNRVGAVQLVGNVEPVLVEPSGYNLRKRTANTDVEGSNVRTKFASSNWTELLAELAAELPSAHATELRAAADRQADIRDAEMIDNLCALAAELQHDSYTPDTYKQAMMCENADRWREALQSEMLSLHSNYTWTLVDRTDDMKVIPSRWLFKIKTDENNFPVRYKCRLVAGGHRQTHGIDFDETFAPVSKNTTVRTLLTVAGSASWKVRQLDVSTAFLHGPIDGIVYMSQPEGFSDGTNRVCKLEKCLYGLKQAPRAWYATFTDHLKSMGFRAAVADPNLWIGEREGVKVFMVIVVDDTLITSSDVTITQQVEQEILKKFPGTSGNAVWFCGMKLNWQPDGSVILTQGAHIEQILEKYNLQDCKLRTLPMAPGTLLVAEGEWLDTSEFPYASVIGACLYISCNTRPDICSTVNRLAKYMSKPTKQHWEAAVNLVGYLRYTQKLGLHLGSTSGMMSFCDSDYASDVNSRRSHTGWAFIVNGGTVAWQSKCQPTVAASTTEAEYMAAASATREALWLRQLLPEFGINCTPLEIQTDSKGALASLNNPQITQRTKHIDVMHHFVRERRAAGQVNFRWVPGKDNPSDILTKPLPRDAHEKHCKTLGMKLVR